MFDTVLPRVLPMAKYQYHWPGTADLYASQVAAAVSANTDAYTREALEAMSNADLEIILAGMGVSANMTKANMVTLILAMQGGDAL